MWDERRTVAAGLRHRPAAVHYWLHRSDQLPGRSHPKQRPPAAVDITRPFLHDAVVLVRRANSSDSDALADLRWAWASESRTPPVSQPEFRGHFAAWFSASASIHVPFLAEAGATAVGMAWLARLPRVIDPTALHRMGGDVQSVYVLPDHRDRGIGEELVDAVLALAAAEGMEHVTVSSCSRALSLYTRSGFEVSPTLLAHVPGERVQGA